MAFPSRYVGWTSSVNDDGYFLSRASRFSDVDDAQRPPHQASKKKMAIAITVSYMVVMALVLCVVLPQRGTNSKSSDTISSLATTSASTKSDALNERMNALDYMEKKRQENFPRKKKTWLRSSSIVTQGGGGIQLDATKEDLSDAIANLSIVDVAILEDEESKKKEAENASKSDALEKRVGALGYMDKKRQEEHPNKQTSLRSSSTIVQGQLDPLFTKEDLEHNNINAEDDDDEEEEEEDVMVNPAADEAMEKSIAEHMDALTYVETKRHKEHPKKKTSVRSSSVVTKGQLLDPLFVDSNNASRAISSAEDDDASSIVEDDDKAIGAPEDTNGRVTEEFLMSHTWTQADFKVVGDFSTNHDETVETNQGE
jgi:fructose-specific phosphotransferase system component IIB